MDYVVTADVVGAPDQWALHRSVGEELTSVQPVLSRRLALERQGKPEQTVFQGLEG